MNISLIGMPGVGKSIIGKKLAEKLNYKFLDIDKIIEKKTNLKLQQIINNFGEEKFLEIEEKTILELENLNNCIISPGGSIIYSEKAMNFLKKNSTIIFLNPPLKTIKQRLANQKQRGIIELKNKNLEDLFKERLILYKKYADITIEMSEDLNINIVIRDIIQKIFNK